MNLISEETDTNTNSLSLVPFYKLKKKHLIANKNIKLHRNNYLDLNLFTSLSV